jgi:hypothetical protein
MIEAFGRHRESGVATSLTATGAETKQGLSDYSVRKRRQKSYQQQI